MYPVVTVVSKSCVLAFWRSGVLAWVPAGLALLPLLALVGCQEGTGSVSQPPVVTIAAAAEDPVAADSPLRFVVRSAPAPRADLVVGVMITPSGCELTSAPTSVTISAGKTETGLQVSADAAGVGSNGCTVTAAIEAGEGYRKGDAASARAKLKPNQQTREPQEPPPPVVTIKANASTVTEGGEVSFTLTADPAPLSNLKVTVRWSEGACLPADPPATVSIPTTGTFELTVTIPDDCVAEQDGSVTATVEDGTGYTVGTQGAATVEVTDNDPAAPPPRSEPSAPQKPVVGIASAAMSVAEGGTVSFTLTADPAPSSKLSVNLLWAVERVGPPSSTTFEGPSPVEIPASSSTATFTVTAPDDSVKNPGTAFLLGQLKKGTGYVRSETSWGGIGSTTPSFIFKLRLTDND